MDIKSQLKEAREAIKTKNFEKTITLCRNVLDKEEDNYLALIFLGLSIQETSQSEESEKLFRRAISISPDNILAWNGLANYFEKIDTAEARLELIKIYTFLLGKETIEKKIMEYCEKLCSLCEYGSIEEICKVICKKIESESYAESTLIACRSSLVNILKNNDKFSDEILRIYEDLLFGLISNDGTATIDFYSQYLDVLHKQKKYEILSQYAMKLFEMYPKDITSMDWICKVYNELYVEKSSILSKFVNIDEVYRNLLELEPLNVNAIFSKAICDTETGELINAKDELKKVISLKSNNVHAWIFLIKINISLHSYEDALGAAKFVYQLIKLPNVHCDRLLEMEVENMHLEALSKSTESSHWEKAIGIYVKLNDKSKDKCLPHYTRANIKLGNMAQAEQSLIEMKKGIHSENDMNEILMAQMLRKQNKYNLALEILNEHPIQSPEWFLEVGMNYFELGEVDKCLLPFLKAAKNDPNNFYCFYCLGKCYCAMKQFEKGRRCYEKAFKLCPTFSDVALELSKVYRLLKNWDANMTLLQTVTKDIINKQNIWAWLQMGLNLMEKGDYNNAIQHLRFVSRVDEDNAHCWEALADAYLYKGAYTSALKAYERVLEISDDASYPALQIALIKKDLGHYHEAMLDFEALLCKNKKCILTLTGLAETCLKKARECVSEQRLGTARDCAQYGVEAVSRAIQQRSELSCLWKILADCCMLVTQLPEKYCCLMITKAFDCQNQEEGDKILEKEELLQLVVRSYCKAIVLTENNDLLWHDLALAYFYQAQHTEDNKDLKNDILTRAQSILQQCTSKNPLYWQHWNLLGVIAMMKDPPNYAISQHAFIKAVTVNRNSAIAWTNLGVLYLKLQNILLANQAFGQAQRADPNYIQSWIGQGILAELLDQGDEAMDLFRHSTDLGFHPQGALGYGHWVCKKLGESPINPNPDVIDKLHAIPVACDALTWYTQTSPYNCCAWNMLGILRERMGLMSGAAEAFKKALNFSSEKYSDSARINFGRVLNRLGYYKESIKICSDVQESCFNSGIWYALALYKDNQFQDSSSIYLAIVQYLANESTIGDVIACMAILTYGLGEPDLARKALSESFSKRQPTARVMYALIALAVLQRDSSLIPMTLKQVELLEDVPQSIEDFASLISHVHMYQGNYVKAIRKISELIHLLPGKPNLWFTLAKTLLYSIKHKKLPLHYGRAAYNASNVALKLRTPNLTHKNISKILCTISAAAMLIRDYQSALISAQKSVFCTPNANESWIVLKDSLEFFPDKRKCFDMSYDILNSQDRFVHIRLETIF